MMPALFVVVGFLFLVGVILMAVAWIDCKFRAEQRLSQPVEEFMEEAEWPFPPAEPKEETGLRPQAAWPFPKSKE